MTPSLELKSAAVRWDVVPEIERIQDTLAKAYLEVGAKAIVTSARDSKHSTHSAHAEGRAIDLRITNLFSKVPFSKGTDWWQMVADFAGKVAEALEKDCMQMNIPGRFDVVVEASPPHLHIEYTRSGRPNIRGWDPKRLVYLTQEVKGYLA